MRVVTYAARSGDFIKIGKTRNLARRLSQLQIGCPLPIVLFGYADGDVEWEAHRFLEELGHERVHGEWFRYDHKIKYSLVALGIWPLELRDRAIVVHPNLAPAVLREDLRRLAEIGAV